MFSNGLAVPCALPRPPFCCGVFYMHTCTQGEATVPSTLGEELDTNPFLRATDPGVRAAVGADGSTPDWEVFGRVRSAKDRF